jgi:transcriptional regulator with XRE-family HTH domain
MPMNGKEKSSLQQLGKRIAFFREEKGLSKSQLGFEAEMDRRQIGRIEAGSTNPTYITLLRISIALDVPLLKLLDISATKK